MDFLPRNQTLDFRRGQVDESRFVTNFFDDSVVDDLPGGIGNSQLQSPVR